MKFGIDISEWQSGVDYARAVSEGGVEFAILRAGYSTYRDDMFETHYSGFSPLVPVGAYLYSYAHSVDAALAEAAAMQKWCSGKKFGLPVFIDMEENSVAALGKSACTAIAMAWCEAMEKAGYRAGVYANANWFRNYLDAAKIGEKYAIWCAAWSDSRPSEKRTAIWQFGGETNYIRDSGVAGVGKPVDQNYILDESVLTGYTPKPEEKPETEEKTVKLNTLYNGCAGDDVRALQILLEGNDCSPMGIDGIFGDNTENAVRKYQRKTGLDEDGIAGPLTWAALLGV